MNTIHASTVHALVVGYLCVGDIKKMKGPVNETRTPSVSAALDRWKADKCQLARRRRYAMKLSCVKLVVLITCIGFIPWRALCRSGLIGVIVVLLIAATFGQQGGNPPPKFRPHSGNID